MEFTTQNGNKEVMIKAASFEDAVNLKKTVMKSLLEAGFIKDINFESLQNIDTNDIFSKLGQLILSMDVSEDFNRAVFACLGFCTYDFVKINKQLFDDKPEIREDYYEIVSKCCEVNLRPFFKSLVSELTQRFQTLTNNIPEQQ